MRFFEARFLLTNFFSTFQFVYLSIIFILSLSFVPKYKTGFALPIQLIILAMIISLLVNYITWGQSLYNSLKALMPYTIWTFFFFLLRFKISINRLEKIMLFYGLLYVVLFAFQFINIDIVYFGGHDEFMTRGIKRIIFPGGGVFIFIVFMALSKLKTNQNKRWLWILIIILGIVIPFLQLIRQFIIVILLIYFYHFYGKSKWYIKLTVTSVIIILGTILFNQENLMIDGLKQSTHNDFGSGIEYIRLRSALYFINDFSPNILNQFFGNGATIKNASNYGNFVNSLSIEKGYYLDDLGIIGFYTLFGILAVIAYIIIWYKSFKIPLSDRFYYLKYYLWFLLFTSLTSYNIFNYNFLITNVIVLYIYQCVITQTKNNSKNTYSENKLPRSRADEVLN